jgi:hypothetical protein
MPTAKAYYKVVAIKWMHGRRMKVLVLERVDKPIWPEA